MNPGTICVVFVLAFAPFAFGQEAAPNPTGTKPSQFGAQTVDPSKPFGTLDISQADPTNPAKMTAWGKVLTDEQRAEVADRCGIISQNAAAYQNADVNFCQSWDQAQAEIPDLGTPPAVTR